MLLKFANGYIREVCSFCGGKRLYTLLLVQQHGTHCLIIGARQLYIGNFICSAQLTISTQYLLVFIAEQNLVGIVAVVLAVMLALLPNTHDAPLLENMTSSTIGHGLEGSHVHPPTTL